MIQSLYKEFQKWSQNGSVWVYSDTHFEDTDCLLMSPDWVAPDKQVKLINQYVTKSDTFILLGDVGNVEWMEKVNGYKVLIKGNHDKGNKTYEKYFDEIYEGPLFIGSRLLLSHEPIYGLDFCLNIHGHDHSQLVQNDQYHFNVAANVIDYIPVSLGKLIESGLLSGIKTIQYIKEEKHKETEDSIE